MTATPRKKRASNAKAESVARYYRFAVAYIANGGIGTDAAIEAGFSAKSAAAKASQLLKHPDVMEIIEAERRRLKKKYQLTNDLVIEKLAKLIHADIRDLYNNDGTLKDPKEWPDDVAMAVTGFEATEEFEGQGKDRRFIGMRKKVRVLEPTAALQLAMRRLGLFEKDNEQSRPVTKVVMVPAKKVSADE